MKIYPGFWDGIVVDTKAPATEPPGAVRIRIYDIHGEATDTPDLQLPWAWPNFMFAGFQCGLIGVPPVQSIVNVIFKHGDKDYPMWIGGGHRTTPPGVPAEFTAAKQGLEPKGWMWITPGGYGIVINEQLKTITLKMPQPSLTQIVMDLTQKKVEVVSDSGPGQPYKLILNETLQQVLLETPTGFKLNLSEVAQTASMESPTGQKVEINEASGEATVSGTAKAILTAALMEIGLGATEAAVLGTTFSQTWLNHGHPYVWAAAAGSGTTGGPVAGAVPPGTPLMPGTELSTVTKLK